MIDRLIQAKAIQDLPCHKHIAYLKRNNLASKTDKLYLNHWIICTFLLYALVPRYVCNKTIESLTEENTF